MWKEYLTNQKRQKYHCDWFKLSLFNLNESSHIYQIGNNKSDYNRTIESIANYIINQRYTYDIQLYNNINELYQCYEFINPFYDSPKINVISKLKIYVRFIDNINNEDIYVIASNLSQELKSKYNPNVFPLYKSTGTTIQVVSIIMNLYEPTKEFIISSLHHEIRHALNYIQDAKLTSLSNKLNYPLDILKNLIKDEKHPTLRNIYNFVRDCTYYTQDTEIKGHLENAYYELEVAGLPRTNIIKLCKILTYAYTNPFWKLEEILEVLPTLDNYIRLLWVLRGRMNDPNNAIFDEEISNQILDIVYHESPQERPYKTSIMDLLKKWERQLMKFLKQFTKAVYIHYDISSDLLPK